MNQSTKNFLRKALLLLTAQLFLSSGYLFAQRAVIPGDFADPSIIRKGKTYYATATSSEWAPHYPIFTSTDLKSWKQTGYVFDKTPEWLSGSFWAPEYFYHNNTYYIYYTARRKKDGISCIGVATSKYPDRGFTDHGVVIEWGNEAIDAFVFNDNGQLYITWKAYGLAGKPIEILGSKLSADGFKLEGEPVTLLRDVERIGLEGQSILKKDDYYYLFSSVGDCCGRGCSYRVQVARAKNIMGPYESYIKNPLLSGDEEWKCTGHGTFVTNTDGKYYYLYHAYSKTTGVYTGRQGLLSELVWPAKNEWPKFVTLPKPVTTQAHITDTFTGNTPDKAWQWDFRNATPVLKQQRGKLHLSGTVKPGNNSGIVLTRRPYTANYRMQVSVINTNAAQKGLVIYGDANGSLGISIQGNIIEYWQVKDNSRQVLKTAHAASGIVQLKMEVKQDLTCHIYWKQTGPWQELALDKPVIIDNLTPWDRSPRPGINFKGQTGEEGVFDNFSISYSY
ncbi:beta-xylosidase [Mucilaginibacter hurinus]|uniref:Beta-xylosidase n=1 Tax=Mucilaginibacter hurinus TaxID=2201324 RepID=A0A367GVA1_9SPHI|nr:glycoside hydrolase family 43 protein [Mucilaginibacter hurinus]RCH56721.1 beta-xylosidase [Mucilaginibacter hurinus]